MLEKIAEQKNRSPIVIDDIIWANFYPEKLMTILFTNRVNILQMDYDPTQSNPFNRAFTNSARYSYSYAIVSGAKASQDDMIFDVDPTTTQISVLFSNPEVGVTNVFKIFEADLEFSDSGSPIFSAPERDTSAWSEALGRDSAG